MKKIGCGDTVSVWTERGKKRKFTPHGLALEAGCCPLGRWDWRI